MTAIITYKTKRSTDEIISDAIDRQQSWKENRRSFTREFLRKINVFSSKEEPTTIKVEQEPAPKPAPKAQTAKDDNESVVRDYWFPILCILFVVLIAIFVIFFKPTRTVNVVVPNVPEPIIKPVSTQPQDVVKQKIVAGKPSFDIVRIEKNGQIVIGGRNAAESNVSVMINKKVVATERTDKNGEFVYAPTGTLKPGNYIISLVNADTNEQSKDSAFIYIPENYANSVSLLMNENGSKIMQSPKSVDGDLNVSTIDYLNSGRIVITGRALPRLRVSVTLNNQYLGYTRVSDYKNYGMGFDIGELKPGVKYHLIIRLHDATGTTIAVKKYSFIMPESAGDDDTFYTVRRGDTLWVIARNFLRSGVLFSIIADCNDIENPNLIYPNQVLQIPEVEFID